MKYFQTFSVTGHGTFPLDMLRYDGCFPLTEADSETLAKACKARPGAWIITLCRYTELLNENPTEARWNSFDVEIYSVKTKAI
jgi:hypothetical protein